MQTRKAARVLPVPVGAAISVSRPRAIAGQPCACASVGPSGKRRSNQARTAGWKEASASMAGASVAWPIGENQAKAGQARWTPLGCASLRARFAGLRRWLERGPALRSLRARARRARAQRAAGERGARRLGMAEVNGRVEPGFEGVREA